jgi:Uma2 family endonuclease
MAINVDPATTIGVPGSALPVNGVPAKSETMPIIAIDMPVMYEDEGQDEMGESEPHTLADHILSLGITAHLRDRLEYRVFSNLNVYYHRVDHWAYVSPDLMVVRPTEPLPERVSSYRIGVQGPAPALMVEILSRRSFQQQDLTNKPIIYSQLGVAEYILVDATGEFMERRLLLRRLQDDGEWIDEQDADGGVTSRLGFRIVLEEDGQLRVIDSATGKLYIRPAEAQHLLETERMSADAARAAAEVEAEARRRAEERVRSLEAELDRLRRTPPA